MVQSGGDNLCHMLLCQVRTGWTINCSLWLDSAYYLTRDIAVERLGQKVVKYLRNFIESFYDSHKYPMDNSQHSMVNVFL